MRKTKNWLPIIAGVLLLFFLIPAVQAESLWNDRSMFADRRAQAVGDILTIVISENFSATRSDSSSNGKKSNGSASAGVGSFLGWLTEHSYDMKDSFSANGSIKNSNNVSARMTATVTAVQPNGNLVIKGTQSIKQNNDEQIISLVGTIRPDDITTSNTVASSAMADAQIFVNGKGPLAQKQKQGILSSIFDFLF
ncbi:MAG: flagellar basal body L-ring protein FlgH [Anaeromusa sp.]|uniref:flagellar basal body L-ring protein FlgH n=1 Tax=Anaeromusa sp. TaxID=1872520 RepID=UPI002B2046AA|nr:flagellar basal body L-ring protein FlgH [Anaeromusa sp.]MEA4833797.1 flagellar basal body L-ring protein FlgH [Anaeromusa sp.]